MGIFSLLLALMALNQSVYKIDYKVDNKDIYTLRMEYCH